MPPRYVLRRGYRVESYNPDEITYTQEVTLKGVAICSRSKGIYRSDPDFRETLEDWVIRSAPDAVEPIENFRFVKDPGEKERLLSMRKLPSPFEWVRVLGGAQAIVERIISFPE